MKTLSAALVLLVIAPTASGQTTVTIPSVPALDPNGPVGLAQLPATTQPSQPTTSMPLPRPPTSQAAPGTFMPLHRPAPTTPVRIRKSPTANIPPNPIFPAGVGGHARTVDLAH